MQCLQLYRLRHDNRRERVGAKLRLTIASTRRIIQGEKLDFWYLVAKIVQATINCTTTTEAGKIVMAPRNSISKSRGDFYKIYDSRSIARAPIFDGWDTIDLALVTQTNCMRSSPLDVASCPAKERRGDETHARQNNPGRGFP